MTPSPESTKKAREWLVWHLSPHHDDPIDVRHLAEWRDAAITEERGRAAWQANRVINRHCGEHCCPPDGPEGACRCIFCMEVWDVQLEIMELISSGAEEYSEMPSAAAIRERTR